MSAWTDDALRRILQRLDRSERPPAPEAAGTFVKC
jgi:hypothetical protein